MSEQAPRNTSELTGMAEEQRIAGLHLRIADFLQTDPFHPEITGAIRQASEGQPASISGIGGEFRIDNTDGSRTPIDNHLAHMPRRGGHSDAYMALYTIAGFRGRTESIEDFTDPEAGQLRSELLDSRLIFAVESKDNTSGETRRTLWVPMEDDANDNDPPTNAPLPLYRRITGPTAVPQEGTTSLQMDYVVLPYLRLPETVSQT